MNLRHYPFVLFFIKLIKNSLVDFFIFYNSIINKRGFKFDVYFENIKKFRRVIGRITSVEIKPDAKVVMDCVSDSSCHNSVYFILISDFMPLMGQILNIKIKHYY